MFYYLFNIFFQLQLLSISFRHYKQNLNVRNALTKLYTSFSVEPVSLNNKENILNRLTGKSYKNKSTGKENRNHSRINQNNQISNQSKSQPLIKKYSKNNVQNTFKDAKFNRTIDISFDTYLPIIKSKLLDKTKNVLLKQGFENLTPIQTQSYEYIYSGVDVIARSRTGSGKTLAFGIPLIEKLVTQQDTSIKNIAGDVSVVDKCISILILEPTRELALQVMQELALVGHAYDIRVAAIYGGVSYEAQIKALQSGAQIIVGTPGRLLDHITKGNLDLSYIKHVVLDEGDTMLEMGFQKHVETILQNVKYPSDKSKQAAMQALKDSDLNKNKKGASSRSSSSNSGNTFITRNTASSRDSSMNKISSSSGSSKNLNEQIVTKRNVQMLLFSATMASWICDLTTKHMKNPIFLDAAPNSSSETRLPSTITHLCMPYPREKSRLKSVVSAIHELTLLIGGKYGGQTIVFTNTKVEADFIVNSDVLNGRLNSKDQNMLVSLNPKVLHGGLSQHLRQQTIKQFKEGKFQLLVATDVASRGIDVKDVDLIIQTQLPDDYESFIHRVGRTARAGKSGTSVVLYSGPRIDSLDSSDCSTSSNAVMVDEKSSVELTKDQRRLISFEENLNIKFNMIDKHSKLDIQQAESLYVTRRQDRIMLPPPIAAKITNAAAATTRAVIDVSTPPQNVIVLKTNTSKDSSIKNIRLPTFSKQDKEADDDDDDDDNISINNNKLSTEKTFIDLAAVVTPISLKGVSWTGTEDPEELKRQENDILRIKLNNEILTGIISDMSEIERERAQLLIARSLRKKDKRIKYYEKIKEEKNKHIIDTVV